MRSKKKMNVFGRKANKVLALNAAVFKLIDDIKPGQLSIAATLQACILPPSCKGGIICQRQARSVRGLSSQTRDSRPCPVLHVFFSNLCLFWRASSVLYSILHLIFFWYKRIYLVSIRIESLVLRSVVARSTQVDSRSTADTFLLQWPDVRKQYSASSYDCSFRWRI